ncbi:homing endonuclease associated repeat-containing protein [Paenibacillus sp. FSL H3-0333]|uniref:homing endonuclease associated repeat-containing protein n=1 Tax=Paenibacillus sp. FSL H3-0333 TaxID=2921373 RepID=UPI0030FA922F
MCRNELIITKIIECANIIGKTPTIKKYNEIIKIPSSKVIINNFGTWNNALREAGLSLNLQKLSIESVSEYFNENGCELLTEQYTNNRQDLKYICKCGELATTKMDSFRNRPHCNSCSIKKKNSRTLDHDVVKNYFEKHECKLLTTNYYSVKQKLDYICSCGNSSQISFDSFRRGHRCKNCGTEKNVKRMKKTIEDVREIFKVNGCKLLDDKYINNKQVLNFICLCGNKNGCIRLSDFLYGRRCKQCSNNKKSIVNKGRRYPNNSGVKHPFWNPAKTQEEREKGRLFTEYKQWRKDVYIRDKYTCQCCGDTTGGNLNAHHLNGWDWCKNERFDLSNGITLCEMCHTDFHGIYGLGGNTKEQWLEYMENLLLKDPVFSLI